MTKHWKKIVAALLAVAIIVVGGSFLYAKVINKADPELSSDDVAERLNETTVAASGTTVAGEPTATTSAPAPVASGDGVDGSWVIASGSEVGYRVDESINGFDTTANGRTQSITGSFQIAATTVTAGDFTVDMTTFQSDESRRDGQFNGRIMEVDTFPTATFVLTAPIDFGSIPADENPITASATGDLTLHGVTTSVTFDVEATFANGRVGVFGQIPVVFADYDIENPSFASIVTEDNGILEFVLIFDRAA